MAPRFSTLAALAASAAVMVGCEPGEPTAPQTVELQIVPGAKHGGRPMMTRMTQEVTATPPWEGDPDGTGQALITVNHGQTTVCWLLEVSDITLPATAAHIHRAPPGVRGPIEVFLSPPDASGRATGCASGLEKSLLREILRRPQDFYVNVHTTDYPPGAVRGQLGDRNR